MLEIIFMSDWTHAAQRLNRLPPLFGIEFTPALFSFPINAVTKVFK